VPGRLEVLLGGAHRHVGELEPERVTLLSVVLSTRTVVPAPLDATGAFASA
jgi:hypothetical protein